MIGVFASLARLARAGWVLARHDALLPVEYQHALPAPVRWLGRLGRLIADPRRADNPGARFARALEALGPAYVKLGQFLATRRDLLDADFVAGLDTLKDRAAPFALTEAEAALQAEFGDDAGRRFPKLEPAIAAASVAQVHKARTEDGRTLAVKILRPGVEHAITRDVAAFRLAAGMAEAMIPPARRLRPTAFVETLARSLSLEMDLRMEAAGASELADIAAHIDDFRTATVDWTRSGKRVLSTRWVHGAALSDSEAIEKIGVDRPKLAVTVIRAFLKSALDHGVFHADMHQGNLFATRAGDLVAVDFGIIGRIDPDVRRYLAEILFGFIRRDYTRIAEVHFEAGYVPARHSVADFAAALRAVGEPIWGKRAGAVSMAKLLLQLFEVTDLFDMTLRPELVLLQKTMVQVEGVARGLDPDFDMWAAAKPVVESWVARELGPAAAARDILALVTQSAQGARALRVALQKLSQSQGDARQIQSEFTPDDIRALSRAHARATRWRFWSAMALGVFALFVLTSVLG